MSDRALRDVLAELQLAVDRGEVASLAVVSVRSGVVLATNYAWDPEHPEKRIADLAILAGARFLEQRLLDWILNANKQAGGPPEPSPEPVLTKGWLS